MSARTVAAAVVGAGTAAVMVVGGMIATSVGGESTAQDAGRRAALSVDLVSAPGCGVNQADAGSGALPSLNTQQAGNARTIWLVAHQVGVGDQGAVVGIAAAMQESKLDNTLTEAQSDRDSAGMFQQRRLWGPLSVRQDPAGSAVMFFTGGQGGQRGLVDVPRWQSMPVWKAAQTVQVSAEPQAYAKWEALARATVTTISGATAPIFTPAVSCPAAPAPGTAGGVPASCPSTGLGEEAGVRPDTLALLRCGFTQFPWLTSAGTLGNRPNKSDHPAGKAVDFMVPEWDTPTGKANGQALADWCRANAAAFGITYVIFYDRIWSPGRDAEGWRPYTHPNGRTTDPNKRHLNHVHVSVKGNAGTIHQAPKP